MGVNILPNLANCIVKNHISTEQYLDSTGQNTLPNIVLIEIWATQIAAPIYAVDGNGFWAVKAENFNIGGSTQISAIVPTTAWATDPQYANFGAGNGSVINEAVNIPNPLNTSAGILQVGANIENNGTLIADSKGKWYTPESMAFAVDSDGNDISTQALANWDYRVNDIFICDVYTDVDALAGNGEVWKNVVCVWVRLRDDWTFPALSLIHI